MKQIALLLLMVAAVASAAVSLAQATGQADEVASPIYGVTIPPGYRDWRMIAANHLVRRTLEPKTHGCERRRVPQLGFAGRVLR